MGVGGAPSASRPIARTSAERLAAVRARPDFGKLQDTTRVKPPFPTRTSLHAAFGLAFASLAFVASSGGPGRLGGFDLAFLGVGLAIFAWNLRLLLKRVGAPLRSFPACVLNRRTEVRHNDDSSTTTYFIGLELERSARVEFECAGGLYSTLRDDEVGVAITRGDELIAFRPV